MNGRCLAVATMIALGFLLPLDTACGQERAPDETEMWADVGVRLESPLGIDATLTQILRWKEEMSQLYMAAPEFALKCGPTGWLSVETGYRYMHERDNDGLYQPRRRVFANTRLRAAVGPVKLGVRGQWQEERRREDDDGTPRRQVVRLRAKAKLRSLGSIQPYASVESFRRIDTTDPEIPGGTLLALRWTLGVEWDWGTRELDLHYHMVSPQHDPVKARRHVVSLGLRFDLDPWQ